MDWRYEKLDENYEIKRTPVNDYDGSITGHIVYGVKAWFDEHPEERIRRGWIKHIIYDKNEIREQVGEWNSQTQFLLRSTRQIDEHTIEDVYHVMNKSEEQMLLEELSAVRQTRSSIDVFVFE